MDSVLVGFGIVDLLPFVGPSHVKSMLAISSVLVGACVVDLLLLLVDSICVQLFFCL